MFKNITCNIVFENLILAENDDVIKSEIRGTKSLLYEKKLTF